MPRLPDPPDEKTTFERMPGETPMPWHACNKCGVPKPISDYYTSTDSKTGRVRTKKVCKACQKAVNQRWSEQNAEKRNASQRRRVQKDKPKHDAYKLSWKLRNLYGITLEEYEAMKARQAGVCAIRGCGRPLRDLDHCHKSGAVRGLLCRPCNLAIGLMDDSNDRIRGLIEYLERHQTMSALKVVE